MRGRRPALIGGIVHHVKWAQGKADVGRTSCGLSFSRWGGLAGLVVVHAAEIVLRPVDCMACVAAGAS